MKRNHRIIAAAVLGTVLAAGAGSVMAFGPKGGGCERMGMAGSGSMGAVYRLDDLTSEQKAKLKAVRDKVRARQDAWREDRQALRDAFLEGADAETLRPLAERQGKQVTERIMLRAQVRDDINAILTDAQRERLGTLMPYGGRRAGRSCLDW